MAEEATDPGVTTPPVEPSAPAEPAQPTEPSVSEDVTNSGKEVEQTVPFERFQEVNNGKKEAEDEARRLQEEIEQLKASQSASQDDVDEDAVEVVKKSAQKLGLVSRADLDAREAQLQVKQDIVSLTSQYKDSGVPFDGEKVIKYAKANNIPVTSAKALDAVYKEMNFDAIIENQRKAAVSSYQETAKSSAERPGSSGEAPSKKSDQPKRLIDRIAEARQKIQV